ncbi:hypothetical protein [Limibacillus halophilus]|uniref:Opacity protein-like surface antigen n=1 Tax=Limibacillus halophilus TaxID=1579333 RepID=A0A839SSN1_9PROT|nr:hypothetical protein [Limibacillus halophilus]MBB3064720.1 opacity protein-like surface antigen [Limibacillus halophilus]
MRRLLALIAIPVISLFAGQATAFHTGAPDDDYSVQVDAGAGFGWVWRPSSQFLRLELGGTVTDRSFGVPDIDDEYSKFHFGLAAWLNLWGIHTLGHFGIITSDHKYNFEAQNISAMGYQLGIISPIGNGFITAPGFGDLYNVNYMSEMDYYDFTLGLSTYLGFDFMPSAHGSPDGLVKPSINLSYGNIKVQEMFSAYTNGMTFPFQYDSKLDTMSWGVDLGVQVLSPDIVPGLKVFADANTQFNYDETDGFARLTPGTMGPYDQVKFDDSKLNVGFTLGAGIHYEVGSFTTEFSYSYSNFGMPDIKLSGTGPAELDTQRAQSHAIMVEGRVRF